MNALRASQILDANLPYYGFSLLALMEVAGKSIADFIPKNTQSVGILCGLGNNGGDGFVAARHLADRCDVTVYLLGKPSEIKQQEAKANYKLLDHCNVHVVEISDSSRVQSLDLKHDLLLDAMLGAGIQSTPREPIASMIRKVNAAKVPIFSVDVPSGSGSDLVCRTDKVLSLHTAKTDDAVVLTIGIPREMDNKTGPGNVRFLSTRASSHHKGQHGHVAIIAGSKRMHGAALYCALAAEKFVDLVTVFTAEENVQALRKLGPNLMVSRFSDIEDLSQFDSILIGPGMDTSEEAKKLIHTAISAGPPCVLDASALRLVKKEDLKEHCVITPHKNEYLSVFGEEPSEEDVQRHSKGCTIVLKGVTDLIAHNNSLFKNHTGNSGMATGGTGDVLAGLIAAFVANNGVLDAVLAATFLNGYAGDKLMGRPFSASDLLEVLVQSYMECL